jgi:hypothetical protein
MVQPVGMMQFGWLLGGSCHGFAQLARMEVASTPCGPGITAPPAADSPTPTTGSESLPW